MKLKKNESMSEERFCKKCGEPLRSTNKRKYCENCRRERAKARKDVLALGVTVAVSSIPVVRSIVKKK